MWPVVSIVVINMAVRKTSWLGSDPLLWFTMMMMPTGPPAPRLIAMLQISTATEEDQNKITRLLAVSYIVSPLLALTVVGALKASVALDRS